MQTAGSGPNPESTRICATVLGNCGVIRRMSAECRGYAGDVQIGRAYRRTTRDGENRIYYRAILDNPSFDRETGNVVKNGEGAGISSTAGRASEWALPQRLPRAPRTGGVTFSRLSCSKCVN